MKFVILDLADYLCIEDETLNNETKTVYHGPYKDAVRPVVTTVPVENSEKKTELPVDSWDVYRTWCQNVRDNWDS